MGLKSSSHYQSGRLGSATSQGHFWRGPRCSSRRTTATRGRHVSDHSRGICVASLSSPCRLQASGPRGPQRVSNLGPSDEAPRAPGPSP
eukprot:5492941-Pyramimonas_sp.AAC.1